ncbi:MAG: hypothetical protein ABI208_08075 [Ginsengibacter sp.]|jgi:hypothetical protein
MEENNLKHEESLRIIHEMIGNARSRIVDNGFSWLIWGTLIILASLSTYFLVDANAENIFMGWNVFGICAVLLFLYSWINPKKKKVTTYVDEVLQWADIGFAVSLLVVIFSINISVSPNNGFGYLLMLYAFLMIIQGGAMHFKPLIFGAVINWLGALGIFYCTVFKYDMLITAAAVFIGYIIPGLMLYNQSKKRKNS